MSLFSDLLVAWPALVLIAAGVLVLVAYGRDPQADEHTVDDYRPDPDAVRARPGVYVADSWQPPARTPRVFKGGSVFAETATALDFWPVCPDAIVAVVLARYGDSPADIAARWLREAADEQKVVTA